MKVTKLDLPVMSSWLEDNQRRLDANPFLSGAFEARVILNRLKAKKEPLQELTKGHKGGIFNGPQFKRHYVSDPEYGVPFMRGSSMLLSDPSNLNYLSNKDAKSSKLSYLKLEEGMTLISCSGTIGRTVYCRSDMAKAWSSQDILKVVPDTDNILPGYLYAYLRSKFGVPLIIFGTYGAIIQHIEPRHIADLPVPRLGEKIETEVHNKISEAARLRTEYQAQVKQATDMLFNSVELQDITSAEWHKQGTDLGYVHHLDSHDSLRAVNFNSRFKHLCNQIKSAEYKELGEICLPGTLKRGGRYKRVDAEPEYGVQLIGQRQLFALKPEGRWVSKTSVGDDVYVEPGGILVAAQGTLGESELYCCSEFIWGSAVAMAYSEHLLRVIADENIMPRGCLFAFMRSETAFRMLRSISFGSKLQDHHPAFLPHLPVPYPDKETQQEIHELVVDAYNKRERSNQLEDDAVKLVEQTIEEGAHG